MGKYRLIYFDIPGRGEVARLLFVLAGVDFEDRRVDKVKEWPTLKPGKSAATIDEGGYSRFPVAPSTLRL